MEQPLEMHDYQLEAVERVLAEPTKAALIADTVGLGKAQPLYSQVLTPDGFKPMGEMSVGRAVITPGGETALVDGVYPQGVRPVYELTLVDGRKVRADEDHIWVVNTDDRRRHGRPALEKTTREIMADMKKSSGTAKWAIDQIEPADFGGEWSSSIDPYFLGLLLGDGCITQNTPYISTADEEIVEHIRSALPSSVKVKRTGGYDYRLSGDNGTSRANPITVELRRLGLMGKSAWNKSVPEELLNTPVAARLALLQGLLDSDGSPSAGTGAEFLSASVDLARQVAWLARSLGGRVSEAVKRLDGKEYQRLRLRLPNEYPPFRLTRKLAKMKPATKYERIPLAIKSIEFVGMEETQCIHLDNEEHQYVTDGFVRTHNTLQTVEIALRAGWERVLFIGIGDTFGQWESTIERQSEGEKSLRRLESTKPGRAAYEDFLAGKDGFYFATIQWLIAQDFEYRDKLDGSGEPIPKIDKKTGLPTGKFERERIHLKVFEKMCKRKNSYLDAVVFDEAHAVSSPKSVGRKTLLTFRGEDGSTLSLWKIGLSATWSGNSFENAWSVPSWLWPTMVPAFWNWREEWCATEDVYVPGKPKPVSQVTGEKEPGKWVNSLPCYIRRESEMPEFEPVKIYVEPSGLQAAQMEDLQKDLMTWVDTQTSAGVIPLVVDVPGAMYSRYKQLALASLSTNTDGDVFFASGAESGKLSVLRGILDAWGDQPVVLFTDSKIFAKLAAERMRAAGYAAAAYTGDASKKGRAEMKEAFIAGKIKYLICTVQTAGTGLDGLQRVCSKVIWLNKPDGDPKLETQGRGRIQRQGMTDKYGPYQEVVLIQRGSADEKILENLISKAASIQGSIGAAAIAA